MSLINTEVQPFKAAAFHNGEFIEVQGTAEGKPFSREFLNQQLDLASKGIAQLAKIQREALGSEWPFA